jgi:DNA-binding NarL/FixJ family response regulator
MRPRRPIRVLVCDDRPEWRALMRFQAEPEADLEVVGEAANGSEALELVPETRPDVVVIDVGMPGRDGLDFLADLPLIEPQPTVVMYSEHEHRRDVAMARGACAFVRKADGFRALAATIRRVARGAGTGTPV